MVSKAPVSRRNGVRDFLLVRASALVLAAFVLFLLVYFVVHPQLSFTTWQHLFVSLPMKLFTLLALVALLVHGWIGMWQVVTDYIKPVAWRALTLLAVTLAVICYLGMGIMVLWGV